MAQIKTRRTNSGETRYTAYLRIKRGGVVVHQESRTFPRQALAADWARRRELVLADPSALAVTKMGEVSISALIGRYIEEFEVTAKWARTKAASLRQIKGHDIARQSALTLTSERIVQHVKERRAEGAGPATVLNDLVWLGVVLRAARGAWGVPAKADVVSEAREVCRTLRLIGKSKERSRTPTYEELEKLDAYFQRQDQRSDIPMRQVMWFAIYSARREAEICRILRKDNDADRRIGIVRDAKHPEGSAGNHRPFRYTPQAWAIAELQKRGSDGRIFPYNHRTVGTQFTRACKVLDIEDLHFHDLRHEATTRLFEAGLSIPDVAAHTLHESWGVLKRYTHIVKRGRILDAPFLPATSASSHERASGKSPGARRGRRVKPATGPSVSRIGKRARAGG